MLAAARHFLWVTVLGGGTAHPLVVLVRALLVLAGAAAIAGGGYGHAVARARTWAYRRRLARRESSVVPAPRLPSPPHAPHRGWKILVLMSDTGGGHRASAEALQGAWERLYPGQIQVEMLDVFTESGVFPYTHVVQMYVERRRCCCCCCCCCCLYHHYYY